MNQINPKELKIVNSLPPPSKKGDKISLDSEFFNQIKERLHRPHGDFAFLGCSFDGETIYYITDEKQVQEFYDRIDAGVHVYVNAKYDITQLRRFASIPKRGLIWDCMLIEQIRFSGYYNSFGLADMARRYLGIYMPKEVRQEFSKSDDLQMTQEQIEYACVDVAATWRIYQVQRSEIDNNDLNIWKEIERPFLWTLIGMQGMKIDVEKWMLIYQKNRGMALDIQKKYMENPEVLDIMDLDQVKKKKLLHGINLASWQQVSAELKRRGIKAKTTQEDDLTPFVGDQFVDDVLEYRGKWKASSTYGKNWIDDGLIESDGRVYSDFYQIGAATGRLSSSSPNVENIPVRDTSEFRECFIAEDDYVLVDADWSAQEPRIFAYQSQDEKLIQIFKEHKDVYIEAARLMFGWELTKKDPRRKERMKPTVLGASYGLTEWGMEKKYGIPKEEGKELLDTFFDVFEGAADYKESQQKIQTYVETIYGRKFWLDVYQRGYENNSLNSPTQGSASDAMKLAGVNFTELVEEAGYSDRIWIINYIHDEILVECHKSLLEWTKENLREVMISVAEQMHEGIPADVEINSGHSWAESHN